MRAMALLAHLEKATVFQRIMECGSLRQAAINLRISQPALSRTLAILEGECDAPLALRSATGLRPTALGLELLELAQRVERLVLAFEQRRLSNVAADARPRLRVGTYESIAVYLFPRVLVPRDDRAPPITLGIDSSARLVQRLVSGDFDCIVSVNPPDRSAIQSEVLFDDHYGLYATRAAATKARKTLGAQSRGAFVPDAADARGTSVASHLASFGIDTESWIACQTFETAKAMALAGVPAILPSRVARGPGGRGVLVAVEPNGRSARFGKHVIAFSSLRRRAQDVHLQRMKEYIDQVLGSEAG